MLPVSMCVIYTQTHTDAFIQEILIKHTAPQSLLQVLGIQ